MKTRDGAPEARDGGPVTRDGGTVTLAAVMVLHIVMLMVVLGLGARRVAQQDVARDAWRRTCAQVLARSGVEAALADLTRGRPVLPRPLHDVALGGAIGTVEVATRPAEGGLRVVSVGRVTDPWRRASAQVTIDALLATRPDVHVDAWLER